MGKTRPPYPSSRVWWSKIYNNNYVVIKESARIPRALPEIKKERILWKSLRHFPKQVTIELDYRNLDEFSSVKSYYVQVIQIWFKRKMMMILEKYTLPSGTKSILKDMTRCCNNLLEILSSFESSLGNLSRERSKQRALFLQEIDSFEKELFLYIEVFSKRYKINFSFLE